MTPTATQSPTPTQSATPTSNIADLSVSITNETTNSVPGTNTVYTIVAQNNSTTPINGISVSDLFPGSITNVSWSCSSSPGSACQTANATGNINVLVNLAANGKATLTASGTIDPNATGSLSNSVTITAPSGISDPNTLNNLAIDTDNLTPQVSFTFTKTDNRNEIAPGDDLEYLIKVENNGPSSVSGVLIQDIFPAALESTIWTCAPSGGASCSANGQQAGNVTTSLNLLPGANATITASATVNINASGTITNTASLTSPINPTANNQEVSDATVIVPQANLTLNVSAPTNANILQSITYTIEITNLGPSAAHNVVLVDQLPEQVTFVLTTAGISVCNHNNSFVTCNWDILESGEKITFTIVVTASASSSSTSNHAAVRADETDQESSNNAVTSLVVINE
jgi:uncharacterized repeat protein (TIGR01451 family)